jgi:hypothetical protein
MGPILYEVQDHVCRACFGRVLKHTDLSGQRHIFTCSNCGLAAPGRNAHAICACGIRLKGGRDAGIRCERNTAPTPEFPSEIVAAQTMPGAGA